MRNGMNPGFGPRIGWFIHSISDSLPIAPAPQLRQIPSQPTKIPPQRQGARWHTKSIQIPWLWFHTLNMPKGELRNHLRTDQQYLGPRTLTKPNGTHKVLSSQHGSRPLFVFSHSQIPPFLSVANDDNERRGFRMDGSARMGVMGCLNF